MPEGDSPFGEIVRRQFKGDLVARQDADVMLPHLAGGIGDQLVTIVEINAKTRIGEHFGNHAVHFEQFFFCHEPIMLVRRAAPEWAVRG